MTDNRTPCAWRRACGRWVKVKSFASVEDAERWVRQNPGSVWAYAKPKVAKSETGIPGEGEI